MTAPLLRTLPLLLGLALAGCNGDSAGTAPAQAPVADGLPISLPPNPSLIDSTWGSSGRLTLSDRTITQTAVDAQNRLLLAGRTATGAYVERLLANGQPDPSFGSAGVVTLSVGDASKSDYPLALVPLASGVLVTLEQDVVGSASTGIDTLLRLDGAGTVVPYATGVSHLAFTNAVAVVRDSSGRLYVLSSKVDVSNVASLDPYIDMSAAGFTGPTNFSTSFLGQEIGFVGNRLSRLPGTITPAPWTLTRFRADGSLDAGFGTGGVLIGTTDPAETMVMAGGDLPRVHFSHCASSTCESWMASLDSNDSLALAQLDTFAAGTQVGLAATLPSNLMAGTGDVVIGRGYVSAHLTSADGLSSLSDVPVSYPYLVAPYPDGFLELVATSGLLLHKYRSNATDDIDWNAGVATRSGYSTAGAATVSLSVDGNGGLYLAGNSSTYSLTYMTPTTPAEVVRVAGRALDTLPDTPATLPGSTLSDGLYHLAAPIPITGLDPTVAVPVRLSQGELSMDGGTTWHRGWVWARNNTAVLVRYPATDPDHPGLPGSAVLTVGGTLSPTNPSLPVGAVLTVSLSGGNAAIGLPASPAPAASGGGGAVDEALGLALALLALRRRRR